MRASRYPLRGGRVLALFAAGVLSLAEARARTPDGSLPAAGRHAVGYRSFVLHDRFRTMSIGGAMRPRPVAAAVWYPARAGTGAPMRIEDYVSSEGETLARAGLIDLPGRRREELLADAARREVPRTDLERLLARATLARRNAAPETTRAPLLLWAHTDTLAKALPAEYLASHGYVVASASVVGTFERDLDVGLSGAETQARDLEVIAAELFARRQADTGRIAIAGMSFGGISEICFALRHPEVRAVISLDGGAGSASGAATVQQSAFFDAGRLAAPILHLYQPQGADVAFFEGLRYARRALVRFPALRHADFSGSGLLDELSPGYLGPPSPDRRAPRAAVWRTMLAFLDRSFNAPDAPFSPPDLPGSEGETRVLDALPPPLLLEDLRAAVKRGGIGELEALYRERVKRDPAPMSEDTCRKLGSWILETRSREEARRLFEIQLEMYPGSARAHYLLGITDARLGDRGSSKRHLERALELLPVDASLDAPTRARIETAVREALK